METGLTPRYLSRLLALARRRVLHSQRVDHSEIKPTPLLDTHGLGGHRGNRDDLVSSERSVGSVHESLREHSDSLGRISGVESTGSGGGDKTKDGEELIVLGGAGSGNFGHAGRPGEVGGSSGAGEATLQTHPDEKLAAHGYLVNPLKVEGGPSAKAAWTDQKEKVETALAQHGNFNQLLVQGKPETVDIDKLASYQTWVNSSSIEHHQLPGSNGRGYNDWRDRPAGIIYHHEGKDWVVDGNNRLSVLKMEGRKTATVLRLAPAAERVRAASEWPEDYEPSREPEHWFDDPELGTEE